MNTTRLNVRPTEPGDDPVSDKTCDILCEYLQPDCEISQESAAEQLKALYAEDSQNVREVADFVDDCVEAAEQIPYDHPSMIRLVDFMDFCLKSINFPPVYGRDTLDARYGMLGNRMRDVFSTYDPAEYPDEYVNWHTFIARIDERELCGSDNIFEKWVIEDAFQKKSGGTPEARNAIVKAALQYLLIRGEEIYIEIKKDGSDWSKWQRWHSAVDAVAASKTADKPCPYSLDTLELAGRALQAMGSIEHRHNDDDGDSSILDDEKKTKESQTQDAVATSGDGTRWTKMKQGLLSRFGQA